MPKSKRQYRSAPDPETLKAQQQAQQKALEDLMALDEWTKEPARLALPDISTETKEDLEPLGEPKEEEAIVTHREPIEKPVEPPKKPWDVDPRITHPYHLVMSEALFQKLDYVWKRNGSRSLRAFVLETLEKGADEYLRQEEVL